MEGRFRYAAPKKSMLLPPFYCHQNYAASFENYAASQKNYAAQH